MDDKPLMEDFLQNMTQIVNQEVAKRVEGMLNLAVDDWIWCEKHEQPMQRHGANGVSSFAAFVASPCPGPHRVILLGPTSPE